EAERARIVADGVTFAAERQSALQQLAALRGLSEWPASDAIEAPPEPSTSDDAAAWQDAVAAHPRVRAAASRTAARRVRARSMQRMAWPELTVRASYGFRSALDGGAMADGMPLPAVPQDNMWSAGVGLMLPIGTGARQGADAAEMNAMADAAASEQQAEALALAAELGALRAQAEAARRTVALLRDTVLVAQQRALAAAWSSYEAGSTDLTGVFDSAHASYSEELDVSRARQQLARTLARLLAVTARPELFGMRAPEARSTAVPTPQERSAR
ncbi:MAG: TolC family protein, partial [Candidatus Eisenbacteria bacterium]